MSVDRFSVEAGHIMMFARAIRDPNPVYYGEADPVADRARVLAPPTFVEAWMHYDPAFAYRPRIDRPWFGSAAQACSAPEPDPAAAAASAGGTSFHAGTELEHFDLLRPGDVLAVRQLPPTSWQRQGSRGGRLWFTSSATEFRRQSKLVVRSTTTVVSTEAKVDAAAATGPAEARARRRPPPSSRSRPPRPAELAVGEAREATLVENLSRGQILLYAGASGDFSPQHTDEIWNTEVAGYPTVFAHGMLTMGMTGRVLTDWFGNAPLRSFGMRFLRQVWPGDDLVASARIASLDTGAAGVTARVEVETANGHGEAVARGTARIELAR